MVKTKMIDFFDFLGMSSAPLMEIMDQEGDEVYYQFRSTVLESESAKNLISRFESSKTIPVSHDFIRVADELCRWNLITPSHRFGACCIMVGEWYNRCNPELEVLEADVMCGWIEECSRVHKGSV